jgi:hypothetical protein
MPVNRIANSIVEVTKHKLPLTYHQIVMQHHITKLSIVFALLAICAPARAGDITPSVNIDLGSVINGAINPPQRIEEEKQKGETERERIRQQAEIEKAKIAAEANKNADKVSPVLAQWGVNRVNCAPGVVFVNGLSTDAVCINPTPAIPAGYYNYNADKKQLVRVDTPAPKPAAPAPARSTPRNPDRDPSF